MIIGDPTQAAQAQTPVTSKEVFAMRKRGEIDEAYRQGRLLIATPEGRQNLWNYRAYAWALVSMIEREADREQSTVLPALLKELNELTVEPDDEVLTNKRNYLMHRFSRSYALSREAYDLRQDGRYAEEVKLREQIVALDEATPEDRLALGWAYYYAIKTLLEHKPINHVKAKEYLNGYFYLELEKPSRLHTNILRLANKLSKEGYLEMSPFLHHWGVRSFQEEDYQPFEKDGKQVMSLAEQVMLAAAKNAVKRERPNEQKFYLGEVERMMSRFPNNIWLAWRAIGLLLGLGDLEDAWTKAVQFAREKPSEYWTWGCLGDIAVHRAPETAVSYYAKALTLSKNLSFISPVKLKFARELAKCRFYAKAKYEVLTVVKHYEEEGFKLPPEARELQGCAWFAEAEAEKVDKAFYIELSESADEVLSEHLPWIDAVLGKTFTVPDNPKLKKREIYVAGERLARQFSVSESLITLKEKTVGVPISIKYETDGHRIKLYRIRERSGDGEDVFKTYLGVITSLNRDKKVAGFTVSETIHGVISYGVLHDKVKPGQVLELQLAEYQNKTGRHLSVVKTGPSNERPEELVCDFEGEYEAAEGNFGFVDDIYIPFNLIQNGNLSDGCQAEGTAVLAHNPKRGNCGWKAVTVKCVESTNEDGVEEDVPAVKNVEVDLPDVLF